MATNLIRNVAHRVKRIVAANFVAGKVIKAHFDNKTAAAAKHHAAKVKARVSGVHAAVKSATKGTRTQRANQLRGMRKNPAQRAQLRRRVYFKTKTP